MENSFSLLGVFGRVLVRGGLLGGPAAVKRMWFARVAGLMALLMTGLLVGGSSASAESCSNEALREATPSEHLSDCRAYEMVSPPLKDGGDVMSDGSRTRAAADGSAVQFLSLRAFGDAQGTGISTEYMAVRGGDGWKTHSITPLQAPQPARDGILAFDPHYLGELSADLGTGVYTSRTPLSSGDANVMGVKNLYLRRGLLTPGSGTYELLTKAADPVSAPSQYLPAYAGASSDFSHVIFMSKLNLTNDAPAQTCGVPGSAGCDPRLYEYTNGGVRLVGLIPVLPATSCNGVNCVPAERSIAGNAANLPHYTIDTISRDGRRIFFTVADSVFGREGAVYVREDGTRTLQVNASEKAIPDAPLPAKFWDASADGSKVFFTTDEQLLDADTNNRTDLYRYDLDAPAGQRLTLLSVDNEPGDDPAPVLDVYGVSDDGTFVYFSVGSQLVAGRPLAPPGDYLLFVWHDGAVAYVGSETVDDTTANSSLSWVTANQAARVTPDGRHLLFVSRSPNEPTGDSSLDCSGLPCRRVYVYSAAADGGPGVLACASCHPGGAPSTTNAVVVSRVGQGGATSSSHLNHAISDDGRRVFFSTGDALVPEDHNGSHYDAYEYDVPSGQAHLISRGTGLDSYFLDASADGSDVFFTTNERLVGSDQDSSVDLYDARVGGGFSEPPVVPAPCIGEVCQGPLHGWSEAITPASSLLQPVGNLKSFSARKGSRSLTRAQRLARALGACKAKRKKVERKKCEVGARRKFGKQAKAGRGK